MGLIRVIAKWGRMSPCQNPGPPAKRVNGVMADGMMVDGIMFDGIIWFDAIMVGGSMAVGVMAVVLG